ncbi:MAG: hypothetical protein IPI58_04340 [Alphaproteobacteria bacterium]|nr:MAG: hypothetical protein IPI58_04340 [Alphaproteobacteria bacterium]
MKGRNVTLKHLAIAALGAASLGFSAAVRAGDADGGFMPDPTYSDPIINCRLGKKEACDEINGKPKEEKGSPQPGSPVTGRPVTGSSGGWPNPNP